MSLIDHARRFAIEAHGDQRYGEHPYVFHLDEVAEIAIEYGETAALIAYLHDVVEDTPVSLEEVEKAFGSFIAQCVDIVSDEPGETRATRKAATYEKMSHIEGELELALLVKAADRLANMRTSVRENNRKFLDLYRAENEVFRKAAYRANQCDAIWDEIEVIQNSSI